MARALCVFTTGTVAGTVRALYGHCTGTVFCQHSQGRRDRCAAAPPSAGCGEPGGASAMGAAGQQGPNMETKIEPYLPRDRHHHQHRASHVRHDRARPPHPSSLTLALSNPAEDGASQRHCTGGLNRFSVGRVQALQFSAWRRGDTMALPICRANIEEGVQGGEAPDEEGRRGSRRGSRLGSQRGSRQGGQPGNRVGQPGCQRCRPGGGRRGKRNGASYPLRARALANHPRRAPHGVVDETNQRN